MLFPKLRSTIVKFAGSYYWKEMSIEEFKVVAESLIINMDEIGFDDNSGCNESYWVNSEKELE